MKYPEMALPVAIKTVCRVPGQIEVLKSFQGKRTPRSPIVSPSSLDTAPPYRMHQSHQLEISALNCT